jgi:peptide/nickel transport system substrate-binding protein
MAGLVGACAALLVFLLGCGRAVPQKTPEQIAFLQKQEQNSVLAKAVYAPGSTAPYPKGRAGGTWLTAINDDPKSFNPLHAQDAETTSIVGVLSDFLLDYDAYARQWKPAVASYKVSVDEKASTMDVTFTLRGDLFWTSQADPKLKEPVTSDDVVFWYNEIVGDPALQQSAYAGQYLQMPDGTKKHIDIEKIDEKTFVLHYPRIVAMPELSSNMDFGPRYIFQPVKKAKGTEGVLDLWAIDTDPRTIPSMGGYFIQSYAPGVQVAQAKNPAYWRKDSYGQSIPYLGRVENRIVPNKETEKLKFLAGELDSYVMRPEDLDEMLNKTPRDYTVYYSGPDIAAGFIAWNQNPKNLAPKYLKWFSNTAFRQAMSCFFNRDRVISEVYRGLAEPALSFFPKPNPFYDPSIKEQFTYDPARGKELLAGIGITPNAKGLMQDRDGNLVAFDIEVPVERNLSIDIASIYADELKKVGITLTVRPIQFQKIVESLMQTYSWQAVMISVGSNYFPIQGDNVWLSSGNLHLWNPLQPKPATAWEAEIDSLYWQGFSERDPVKAKAIWDRYQRLILDQLPVMYMVYPDVFTAVRGGFGNVRVDTIQAPDMNYVYQTLQ